MIDIPLQDRVSPMEPVWHRRFPGCSLARHALQHGANATSPSRTDSVLLRAVALHGPHHTAGATEEIVSPSAVAGQLGTSYDDQVSGLLCQSMTAMR